jgi:hypothetical protein
MTQLKLISALRFERLLLRVILREIRLSIDEYNELLNH